MNTSEAMNLAAKLAYYYDSSTDSTAINSVIAQTLGKERYEKFCDITVNPMMQRKTVAPAIVFKKKFLNNPVEVEDEARDEKIQKHYSLDKLIECLAQAIS